MFLFLSNVSIPVSFGNILQHSSRNAQLWSCKQGCGIARHAGYYDSAQSKAVVKLHVVVVEVWKGFRISVFIVPLCFGGGYADLPGSFTEEQSSVYKL